MSDPPRDPPEVAPVAPRRWPVVPRARVPDGGAVLPLERHVLALLKAGERGRINLFGPRGSGKSAALEHLAAVLPADSPIALFDNGANGWNLRDERLVVYTSREQHSGSFYLEMAPWGDDDLIEYLAATHRALCGNVMERVNAAGDREGLVGLPELWRIVLDEFASDGQLRSIPDALRRSFDRNVPAASRANAGELCLSLLGCAAVPPYQGATSLEDLSTLRLLHFPPVQTALAARGIVEDLRAGRGIALLQWQLPRGLVDQAGKLAAADTLAIGHLKTFLKGRRRSVHSMAASILHSTGIGWKPRRRKLRLCRAYLDGASWPEADLRGANLIEADLPSANLQGANLDGAVAAKAHLSGANLRGASLTRASFKRADLGEADLSHAGAALCNLTRACLRGAKMNDARLHSARLDGADLEGACLAGCDLHAASLHSVKIAEADFSGANLTSAVMNHVILRNADFGGACFCAARLRSCDLEYLQMPKADFSNASLKGCNLTGSNMPDANFRNADLRGTGLAEIEWEGADLRDADLRQASFHMGSTRSGLVGSVLASEGTRTGFYTDDFDDRQFKPPHEIRKANLCGADLRGAMVEETDFYLVDLRGATYTADQGEWFLRCGAILGSE